MAAGVAKPGLPTYRLLPDYGERLGAYEWPLAEALHADAFVGSAAVDAVAAHGRDPQPLFLQVGFPGPHPPYDPPAAWLERYRDRDLPVRPVRREDLDEQPLPFRQLREKHASGHHDSARTTSRTSLSSTGR
jgi:hypothetical protein